jgi:hypothetical protein
MEMKEVVEGGVIGSEDTEGGFRRVRQQDWAAAPTAFGVGIKKGEPSAAQFGIDVADQPDTIGSQER